MTETLALDTEFFNSNEKNQFNVAGVICTSTTETLKFDLVNHKHKFIEIIEGYKNKKIIISSFSKQYLHIFKQQLRLLRMPDAYKKKGIRYYKEIFKLKQGKKTR